MAGPSVLHVVESTLPRAGSIAVCLEGLIQRLRQRGLDSSATDSESGLREAVERSDVVHIHGWRNPVTLGAARLARTARKPYVLSPLGALTPTGGNRTRFVERLVNYFKERRLIRSASAITSINEEDDRRLRSSGAHPRIQMLPYGIPVGDYATDRAAASDQRDRLLLMLGPVDSISGCVPLLKAFAELGTDADGWRLALVGPDVGHWRKMLQAAVHRKGGGDRVIFADADTVPEQRSWIARASLVVAPSLHVRPGVSIMQAAASGVPALTTVFSAVPGLHEVVTLVGPSRAELREALRSTMTMIDHARREQAHRVQSSAGGTIDWSALVEQYLELYRSIA